MRFGQTKIKPVLQGSQVIQRHDWSTPDERAYRQAIGHARTDVAKANFAVTRHYAN